MKRIALMMDRDGHLLIGIDLKKEVDILNAAYNDAAGITAEFNLNLLARIRDELDSDIDPNGFEHSAFYNRDRGRIEMHLVSRRHQSVSIAGRAFEFQHGETIHTEDSHKYTVESFHALAAATGWTAAEVWTDPDRLFSVHYLIVR